MTKNQAAAYVFAQGVLALAEIEGMKAENAQREFQGYAPAYREEAFAKIETTYVIGHNDVLTCFEGCSDA